MANIPTGSSIDLSIVIPARNEADNLAELIPLIRETLDPIQIAYEIIVVDELADEKTRQVLRENNTKLLSPVTRGYGKALKAGFMEANGEFIVTMDADISHPPNFLNALWKARQSADVLIASRYVSGGKADMPISRYLLSKILNYFFGWGLGLHVRDMSSGYRLYVRHAIQSVEITASNFDVLQEIIVKASLAGYQIREIPFAYYPRKHGSSHARVIQFGLEYLRLFFRLWIIRFFRRSS